MTQAPQTLDGWFVLHDFRTIDWARWKQCSLTEQNQMLDELQSTLAEFGTVNDDHSGSFGAFAIAGHKADILLLHMRPTVEELEQVKTKFNKTAIADYLTAPYSYVSVVELGGYLAKPGVDPDTDPYLQGRLKPSMPEFSQICFYPMSKKRDGADNWYTLPESERVDLMRSHGTIGRKYADHIKQIVTGSMGLDDWEWGVTLFSDEQLQFKKIVYEMRFDEASARFGEFGPFYVGYRVNDEQLQNMFTV